MKKAGIGAVVIAILLLQVVVLFTVSDIDSRLDDMNRSIAMQVSATNESNRSTQETVQQMLTAQNSRLDSVTYEIGALNTEDFTLPITLAITLKEQTAETAVSVQLGEQSISMERQDMRFIATVSIPLFSPVEETCMVHIQNGDVILTETTSTLFPYIDWQKYLPNLQGRVDSLALDYEKGTIDANCSLELYVFFDEMQQAALDDQLGTVKNLRLLVAQNGGVQEVWSSPTLEEQGIIVPLSGTIENPQLGWVTLWLEHTDQYGLIHRTCIYFHSLDNAYKDVLNKTLVYKADGSLLHAPYIVDKEQIPDFS